MVRSFPVRPLLFAAALLVAPPAGFTQTAEVVRSDDGLWMEVAAPTAETAITGNPREARTVALDMPRLTSLLATAPGTGGVSAPGTMTLPLPQGGFHRFSIRQVPVECPGFQGERASIVALSGLGLDDPVEEATLIWNEEGLQAIVSTVMGNFVIEPEPGASRGIHRVFDPREIRTSEPFRCEAGETEEPRSTQAATPKLDLQAPSIADRRSWMFRLVLGATGGYVKAAGGTEKARNAMAAAVAFANPIFRRELGVAFCVQRYLLYPPAPCGTGTQAPKPCRLTCDRYGTAKTLEDVVGISGQNPDFFCPKDDFDLGHILTSLPNNGNALTGVCREKSKVWGATGVFNAGQGLTTNLVFVHELAHQLGAGHTFSALKGACEGQAKNNAAVEPGSGSTLMSYAGGCEKRLQPENDDYFHQQSLSEIVNNLRGLDPSKCGIGSPSPLASLSISAPGSIKIPAGTSFSLSARPAGPVASINWEETDRSSGLGHPFFRSFKPSASPTRVFPRPGYQPEKGFDAGETLPSSAVNLTFAATARDGQGGLGWTTTRVSVLETSFKVKVPFDALVWPAGEELPIEWEVPKDGGRPLCRKIQAELRGKVGSCSGTTEFDKSYTVPEGGQAKLPVAPDIHLECAKVKLTCIDSPEFTYSSESEGKFSILPPPTAAFIYALNRRDPLLVAPDASPSTSPNGRIRMYEWWFRRADEPIDPSRPQSQSPKPQFRAPKAGRYLLRLRVTDEKGSWNVKEQAIELSQAGKPPTAVCDLQLADSPPSTATAGETPPRNQGVEGAAPLKVALASRSEDQDGPIARCHWDFGNGPGADACEATHEYRDPGTYKVQLRVWDLDGLQGIDECQVEVNPNLKPTAVLAARPKNGAAPLAVILNAGKSLDPERRPLHFEWTFGDGSAGATTDEASLEHEYRRGTWTASVAAVDDLGNRDIATIEIHADGEPSAAYSISLGELAAPLPATFDGSASRDPEGLPLAYFWQFGDGGEATGPTATHTYANPGSYRTRLEVKDAFGLVDGSEQTIRINSRPEVALAADPDGGNAPLDVTLAAEATDPDEDRLTFHWNFGDGEEIETTEPSATHRYAAGDFTASVTATDSNGAWKKATAEIHANARPVARFVRNPRTIRVGRIMTLDGSGSADPDGDIVAWRWSVEGRSIGTTAAIKQVFSDAGTFDVRLEVKDDEGAADVHVERVVVRPNPRIEPANAEGPAPLRITFRVEDVPDPNATFRWAFPDDDQGMIDVGPAREIAHTFEVPGYSGALVIVSDDAGDVTAETDVHVLPPLLEPDPWYLCDHPDSMIGFYSPGAGIFFHRVGWQEQVWIAGTRYTHAIGMHPGVNSANPDQGSAWADFLIPPGARTFRTIFGMARQDINPNNYGEAFGSVSIDGRTVWSGMLRGPNRIDLPAIAIPAGARLLRLFVDSAGSRWSDHTTWADPRFLGTP